MSLLSNLFQSFRSIISSPRCLRPTCSCRVRYPILAIVIFLFPRSSHSQTDYRISEVTVTGNTSFPTSELLDNIELKTPNWFEENILSEKPVTYTEETPDRTALLLRNFYQQEGYLYVVVHPPLLEVNDDKQTIKIAFTLEEHRPVVVDSLNFRVAGLTNIPSRFLDSLLAILRPKLSLKRGIRFRDVLASKDKELITVVFMNSGFPYLRVDHVLRVDTAGATVKIDWNIDPGPRSSFGEVTFLGNVESSEDVMRPRLDFEPGEVYDHSKLTTTQKDLYTLGIYQVVSCKAQVRSDQSATVPVQIVVKEAAPVTTKFGVGYGKEDKFRVFTNIQWIRFLGGARALDLFLKHSALEPIHASLTFTQPDFVLRLTKFIINPYIIREVEPAYSADRFGANLSLKKNFTRTLDGHVTFNYERVNQDGVDSTATSESTSGSYRKTTLSTGLLNDTSIPLFDPATGWYTFGGLSFTSFLQSSLSKFFKVDLELRNYDPLNDWIVLASRLKTSLILPTEGDNTVPIEERLFSGGATSVRGFPLSSLGPVAPDGKPLGGNTLLEASLEARFPIAGIFSGGIFSDAGNVWEQSHTYRLSELRYSMGAGLRAGTPVGPVRLDIAWPVFEGSMPAEYYFTIGHAF